MAYHAALGLRFSELDVAVVDANRTGLNVLRTLLSGLDVKRIRCFASASDALRDMQISPPNLLVADWVMEPVNGCDLIHMIRYKNLKPLCFLPAILIAGKASPNFIDQALKAGAHQVLVKPVSFEMISRRLKWILADDRHLVLNNARYEIENARELIAASREQQAFDNKIGELVNQIGGAEFVEKQEIVTSRKHISSGLAGLTASIRSNSDNTSIEQSQLIKRAKLRVNTQPKPGSSESNEILKHAETDDIWHL